MINFGLNFEFQLNFQLRGCISRAGREDQNLSYTYFLHPPLRTIGARAIRNAKSNAKYVACSPTNTISDLEIHSTNEFQIATMPKNGLIPNENYKT